MSKTFDSEMATSSAFDGLLAMTFFLSFRQVLVSALAESVT